MKRSVEIYIGLRASSLGENLSLSPCIKYVSKFKCFLLRFIGVSIRTRCIRIIIVLSLFSNHSPKPDYNLDQHWMNGILYFFLSFGLSARAFSPHHKKDCCILKLVECVSQRFGINSSIGREQSKLFRNNSMHSTYNLDEKQKKRNEERTQNESINESHQEINVFWIDAHTSY